MHNNTEILN